MEPDSSQARFQSHTDLYMTPEVGQFQLMRKPRHSHFFLHLQGPRLTLSCIFRAQCHIARGLESPSP